MKAEINEHDEELDAVRWADSETLQRALEQQFGDNESEGT